MSLDDAFERCLASFYEAALDDAHWPVANALFEEASGAVGSMLVVGERCGKIYFTRPYYRGVVREDLAHEYFVNYYPHDEAPHRRRELPSGQMVHALELYTEEELKTSIAYNEGWRLLHGQNGVNINFRQSDGLHIFLGVGDPASGEWTSDALQMIERLGPHIQRAVSIRQALAAADALDAGLAGLMENDRIGVVQLDRGGRMLEANAVALEILRREDGLLDRDGTLDARLPADSTRLHQLLVRALPGNLGEAPSGGSMTVHQPLKRTRLGLHVTPVGEPADFGGRRVAAMVLVVDPARRQRIDAQRVAALLGLTPSESRMAALLAEGLRVREIATAQGWSESYVRWLVERTYRKLGVSGQVALVRHVLAVDALPQS